MDPRIILKLLEGREDVITPLAQKHEQIYTDAVCPTCGSGSLVKVGDPNRLFRSGKPLAHYQLDCSSCGCLFDPHSGMVIKAGCVGAAVEPAIPLINND